MNKSFLFAIAAALLVAPMALAHVPEGTPKNYCEPESDWAVHDYAVGTSFFILGNEDGNLAGDCDGITNVDPGTPCAGFDDPNNPLTFFVGLCDADINPPVADYDGHTEFATGGAWIYACDSACGDAGAGAGTTVCFGDAAHHTEMGTITAWDQVLGAGVTGDIAADTIDFAASQSGGTIPPNPCGDFESDVSQPFTGTAVVTIPAGLDGSYQVYIQGSAGHVTWP